MNSFVKKKSGYPTKDSPLNMFKENTNYDKVKELSL
jgi:hypothetical protein